MIVYDGETGETLLKTYTAKSWSVSADFSPDGKKIIIESRNTAEIWDVESGEKLFELGGKVLGITNARFNPAAFYHDEPKLLTVCSDTSVRLWDLSTLDIDETLRGHKDRIYDALFSPDQKLILTAGGSRSYSSHFTPENAVKIWEFKPDPVLTGELTGFRSSVLSIDISHDGKKLAATSCDGNYMIWDMESRSRDATVRTSMNWGDCNYMIRFSPGDSLVAIANDDGRIIVRRVENSEEAYNASADLHDAYSVDFSKDGQKILFGGSTFGVQSYSFADGEYQKLCRDYVDTSTGRYKFITGPKGSINSVVYNHNDTRVLTADQFSKGQVWDIKTNRKLFELSGHTSALYFAKYTHDNNLL